MEKIQLVTDSCSSLTPEECKKRNIVCLEMTYTLNDVPHTAFDEEEVSLPEFYKKLEVMKSCSTSNIALSTFEECFEKLVSEGKKVVYIGLSSALSSTFSYAQAAAKSINEKTGKKVVAVINSNSGSYGEMLVVDATEEALEGGVKFEDIEEHMNNFAQNVASAFVAKDLNFIHKCGRLNIIEAKIGTLFRIVPIICIDKSVNGKLKVTDKCIGTKLAYKTLRNKFLKYIAEHKSKRCYIASCDLDTDAEELKKFILENTDIKEEYIKVGYIDKTMSCCCGPKTLAIFAG